MRYRYFTDANLNVICISTYAGKTVRGVAKCDITHDKFNEECGKNFLVQDVITRLQLKELIEQNKKFLKHRRSYLKLKKCII